MSFILDALRKSEARRRMGQAPELALAPAGTPQAHKTASWRIPVLALGGLILVGFGLLAGRLLYWQPKITAPPAAESRVDMEDGTGPREPRPGTVQAPAPETDPRDGARADPLEAVAGEAAPDPEPAPRVAAEETESRQDPARDADTPAGPPAAEMRARADIADAETGVPEPEEEEFRPEREVRGYVQRWELPLNVRRELPALDLTIHVFSADPAARFVLVNGERYVEGDQLAPGVNLVSILREGAVVDFRDHRFLLAP